MFDRILFGRQPKCIIAHRVQDVKTLQSFKPCIDIRCDITQADVLHANRRRSDTGTYPAHNISAGRIIDTLYTLFSSTAAATFFNFSELVFHNILTLGPSPCEGEGGPAF